MMLGLMPDWCLTFLVESSPGDRQNDDIGALLRQVLAYIPRPAPGKMLVNQ